MTLAVWPAALNSLALSGTWKLSPIDELRKTDFDKGPSLSRRMFTRLLHQATFTVFVPNDQIKLLKGFYFGILNHGADRFTMPVWDGEVYSNCTVKFDSVYQASDYGSTEHSVVTCSFTIYDLPILDGAALYLIGTYGEDFILNNMFPSLREQVNVTYPSATVNRH